MNVICLTTTHYVLNAVRLCRSLKALHPQWSVTVYIDDEKLKPIFAEIGCSSQYLPEINQYGYKKAKFYAYMDAVKTGEFLYLDADIIVLQDLSELVGSNLLTVCRDAMNEYSFIENKAFPWPKRPHLSGARYFDDGVFYAPAHLAQFFEICLNDLINTNDWEDIIIPGFLTANHYFCAKVEEHQIPLNFVSEFEYNWQGFRSGSTLRVRADDSGNLYNLDVNKLLRLVHFAGVTNIDPFIQSLPLEIQKILGKAVRGQPIGILEIINSQFAEDRINDNYKPGIEKSLPLATTLKSMAYSIPPADIVWNGLTCGGEYFSAIEYWQLKNFIQSHKIQCILETGAKYPTKILFNKIGTHVISIDPSKPEWNYIASKSFGKPREGLENGNNGSERSVDFVFIDFSQSPERINLIRQLLESGPHISFLAIYHSLQDAKIIYKLSAEYNLKVVKHVDSLRGLTFLANSDLKLDNHEAAKEICDFTKLNFKIEILSRIQEPSGLKLFLKLINISQVTIPFVGPEALYFSYHLLKDNQEVIKWDNPRYELPVDLDPFESLEFYVTIQDDAVFDCIVQFDLVKENAFWWSQLVSQLSADTDLQSLANCLLID